MDSVLMSLPPLASWPGTADFPGHSPGAQLREMLRPRDWAAADLPEDSKELRLA
jgi:coproporphyrinogen III oxidase